MPTYAVSVVDRRGIRRSLREAAPDEAQLRERLRARQLWTVAVRPVSERKARRLRIPTAEFVPVLDQLELMLRAGITADVALRQLAEDAPPGPTKVMFGRIAAEVAQGRPIHEACRYFERQFPAHVAAVIAAGEAAARLPESLRALTEHLTQGEELGRTARRAMIYPAIVCAATSGLVVFLLGGVVPRFAEIFQSLNVPLPALTRGLIGASELVRAHGGVILGGVGAIGVSAWLARKHPHAKRIADATLLHLPVLGETVRCLATARIAAHCRLLHEAGVPVLDALSSAAERVNHAVLAEQLRKARTKVAAGSPLHAALPEGHDLPAFVVPALKAGEASGQLGAAWRHIEDYAARRARQRLATALALLEPALLAVLTGVVGGIALSFFLPLFSLLGGLNSR